MQQTIDMKTFWRAVGQRALGSTVVTARGPEGPAGFLGLSSSHVCAEPPTMLVSIDKRTGALATVREAGHFALNYLARDAAALAESFGGKGTLRGAERFTTMTWRTSRSASRLAIRQCRANVPGFFTSSPYIASTWSGSLEMSATSGTDVCIR